MGPKKKAGGAKKGKAKGKKEKKPKDAVGEAVNEVEEAERKVCIRTRNGAAFESKRVILH